MTDTAWTKALNVNPYTGQQGTRAPHVDDMQWRPALDHPVIQPASADGGTAGRWRHTWRRDVLPRWTRSARLSATATTAHCAKDWSGTESRRSTDKPRQIRMEQPLGFATISSPTLPRRQPGVLRLGGLVGAPQSGCRQRRVCWPPSALQEGHAGSCRSRKRNQKSAK